MVNNTYWELIVNKHNKKLLCFHSISQLIYIDDFYHIAKLICAFIHITKGDVEGQGNLCQWFPEPVKFINNVSCKQNSKGTTNST